MNNRFKCPFCGKGNIRKTFAGYVCNYMASINEKCNLQIPLNVNGVEITESILDDIVNRGRSEYLIFKQPNGKRYRAYLTIFDGFIRVNYKEEI